MQSLVAILLAVLLLPGAMLPMVAGISPSQSGGGDAAGVCMMSASSHEAEQSAADTACCSLRSMLAHSSTTPTNSSESSQQTPMPCHDVPMSCCCMAMVVMADLLRPLTLVSGISVLGPVLLQDQAESQGLMPEPHPPKLG
jgi:hypothetical protein